MTAVEFLESEIPKLVYIAKSNKVKFDELINQVKEIEKKIIAQAFEDGDYNYFYSKKTGKEFESGIEYYNEKFKQQ